jgi:hypothetical protein
MRQKGNAKNKKKKQKELEKNKKRRLRDLERSRRKRLKDLEKNRKKRIKSKLWQWQKMVQPVEEKKELRCRLKRHLLNNDCSIYIYLLKLVAFI